jgi:hypothetical protein
MQLPTSCCDVPQGHGARAFRFTADPPTTTTQRLKSLMTVRPRQLWPGSLVHLSPRPLPALAAGEFRRPGLSFFLCLLQGGLPSFFDVSSSFTAGDVQEDNLIDQLAAAGRKLVRVTAFDSSLPPKPA